MIVRRFMIGVPCTGTYLRSLIDLHVPTLVGTATYALASASVASRRETNHPKLGISYGGRPSFCFCLTDSCC